MQRHRVPVRHHRGAVILAIIVTMLLISLIVVGLVLAGAREQDLTVRRLETVRSFYAAEAGMNMAVREIMLSLDADADGFVGTVSDDGNAVNDPTLSSAQVNVTKSVSGLQTTLTSQGRSGAARRKIQSVLQ